MINAANLKSATEFLQRIPNYTGSLRARIKSLLNVFLMSIRIFLKSTLR